MLRASAAQNPFPSYTFATLPSASAVASGFLVNVSDWGANGTLARSNGTRWLAQGGETLIKKLGANVTGITATENVTALQFLFPINCLQANDVIRITFDAAKSGTTDVGQWLVHVGPLGTAADASVSVASNLMAAAQQTGGAISDIKIISTIAAGRLGSVSGTGAIASSSASAYPGNVVITDTSANALYVSLGLKSGGATDTLTLQHGEIWHITG